MTSKTYSKDELKAWEEYDQTFSDPMDIETVENFSDLDKDNVADDGWAVASFGGKVFERVGNGHVTDATCGTYKKTMGCLNIDLHAHMTLEGSTHTGMIPLKKIFMSCDKPSCPTCYKRGWANREATNAQLILEKASTGFIDKNGKKHMGLGLPEHIISSVPQSDYGLPFEKLKAKCIKLMRKRGVMGGIAIFHLFRYRNFNEAFAKGQPMGWYISPHFHTVGFIDGGYGRCRVCDNTYEGLNGERCVKENAKCLMCKRFEGLTRSEFMKECSAYSAKMKIANDGKTGGWIVKVMGKRKNLHGTLWYQLNHATFARGSARAQVATWFGVCSYTKLQLTKEDKIHRVKCPICQHDMEEVKRVGGEEPDWWVKEWEEPYLDKDGIPNWILTPDACKPKSKWARRGGE